MATNLETSPDQGQAAATRPNLKITGLHIRGLKSIKSLDLPEDGLGWEGPFPDVVVIGGINGSGKTTLLEFIFGVFERLADATSPRPVFELPKSISASTARVDIGTNLHNNGGNPSEITFMIGDPTFIAQNRTGNSFALERSTQNHYSKIVMRDGDRHGALRLAVFPFNTGDRSSSPAVVYFPSERKTLISPKTQYKPAGGISESYPFLDRWSPPENWDGSLEARLYAVRWADLNAKEAGRPEEAQGFAAYAEAFARFFEGRKQLVWTPKGELVVKTRDGTTHDLSELSSGEKQVVLFAGELLHRWRPGSLVMIDEPELHLHESFQTRLWEMLTHWQRERGGQLIVATQSVHLFGLAENGTRLILGGRIR